eukprot:GHVT01018748.1.p1 GENE.GHVT01018748.1~~GHVT01018748.1.p1  ORF type:complete len:111 (+),score=20.68 GHVT01018748.1:303-635(+)
MLPLVDPSKGYTSRAQKQTRPACAAPPVAMARGTEWRLQVAARSGRSLVILKRLTRGKSPAAPWRGGGWARPWGAARSKRVGAVAAQGGRKEGRKEEGGGGGEEGGKREE